MPVIHSNRSKYALFNKIWNIATPASAYRLNTINDAIDTIEKLRTSKTDTQIKKKDFTPVLKGVKKNYVEESPPEGFLFYKSPNPTEISNAVNKYYNNVNYVLPKNYDYVNRQSDVKKTYNFKFDGDIMEISNFLKMIYSKQNILLK